MCVFSILLFDIDYLFAKPELAGSTFSHNSFSLAYVSFAHLPHGSYGVPFTLNALTVSTERVNDEKHKRALGFN